MERIYPKKAEEPIMISLLEAARMAENGGEPFVLFPTDDERHTYERQTLKEFVEDCMFFQG